MLNQILVEIKNNNESVPLSILSARLNIERSALEGMLTYWSQKGRLVLDDEINEPDGKCATGSCGVSCSGPSNCGLIVKLPRTFSIPVNSQDKI